MSQIPSRGRMVTVKGMLSGDNPFDPSCEAAAIITQVIESPRLVHVTAFPAMSAPKLYNDVPLYATRDAAYAPGVGLAAFWPERT